MKKITTAIKTMFFGAIVLVMAQSCIPTTPTGGNPTPNPNLVGKIKSSNWVSDLININYMYNYNSDGKLTSFTQTLSQGINSQVQTFTVEYQVDKIIIKNNTNTPTDIFYLQPNTNLIDSVYNVGSTPNTITIQRDSLNNIVKIGNNTYGFSYENDNLKSFWDAGFWTPMSGYYFQFTYDNSKLKKAGTDPYSTFGSSNISTLYVDILGLSLGNTSPYAISTKTDVIDVSVSSVNYSYTNYTPTNVTINLTGNLSYSFIKWKSVNNTYY